jgi:hypothetical protein
VYLSREKRSSGGAKSRFSLLGCGSATSLEVDDHMSVSLVHEPLDDPEGRYPVDAVQWQDYTQLRALLPEGVPPGSYHVEIVTALRIGSISQEALLVVEPCHGTTTNLSSDSESPSAPSTTDLNSTDNTETSSTPTVSLATIDTAQTSTMSSTGTDTTSSDVGSDSDSRPEPVSKILCERMQAMDPAAQCCPRELPTSCDHAQWAFSSAPPQYGCCNTARDTVVRCDFNDNLTEIPCDEAGMCGFTEEMGRITCHTNFCFFPIRVTPAIDGAPEIIEGDFSAFENSFLPKGDHNCGASHDKGKDVFIDVLVPEGAGLRITETTEAEALFRIIEDCSSVTCVQHVDGKDIDGDESVEIPPSSPTRWQKLVLSESTKNTSKSYSLEIALF